MKNLPAQVIGVEGDRFKIVFNFIGFPAPQICWEKDGSAFLIGEGREIINSHGRSVLKINSLALSDAGVNTCLLTSVARTRIWVVRLKVEGKGTHEVMHAFFFSMCTVAVSRSPQLYVPPQFYLHTSTFNHVQFCLPTQLNLLPQLHLQVNLYLMSAY